MDEYIKRINKAYVRFNKKFNKRLKPAIVALAKAIREARRKEQEHE